MQKAKIQRNIFTKDEIDKFVKFYFQESGAMLQVKHHKIDMPKIMDVVQSYYRCYHDTRYENTRNEHHSQTKKRYQNTFLFAKCISY